MTEIHNHDVDIASITGEVMSHSFKDVFKQTHFDESLIQTHGVISADIGFGAEIFALKLFNPSRFIAGEPRDFGQRGREIDDAMTELNKTFPQVTIMREPANALLRMVKQKGLGDFGLVTWLNVFPDMRTSPEQFHNFFSLASDLLHKEGMAIISLTEDADARRTLITDTLIKSIPGMQLSLLTPGNSVGNVCITGRKING